MVAGDVRIEQNPPRAEPRTSPRMEVECAVYRHGRIYRAVCLDLGLIVERPTADAARDELLALARDHVADGLQRGLTVGQIRRPVPREERLYVYRRLATSALKQWLRTRFSLLPPGRRPPQEGFMYHYCSV
jgi:hypothetical protein